MYIAHFAFIQILYAAILSIFQDRLRVFVEDNSTSKCNKKCDKSMSIERGTSLKILERKKISQLIPFTSYTQFVGETQGMPVAVIIRCLSYVSGNICILYQHYSEIIMTPTTSQITSLIIVYLTVYLGADKKNIKAPRHWLLCGEFTGDRWIPSTNGQKCGKRFHLMTPSWWLPESILPHKTDL